MFHKLVFLKAVAVHEPPGSRKLSSHKILHIEVLLNTPSSLSLTLTLDEGSLCKISVQIFINISKFKYLGIIKLNVKELRVKMRRRTFKNGRHVFYKTLNNSNFVRCFVRI